MENLVMNDPCDKLILAEGLDVRLIYCKNRDVMELEFGAISLRLSPSHLQQIANVMMKASLQLDRMVNLNTAFGSTESILHLH